MLFFGGYSAGIHDSITCKCDQYHETQSIIFSFCDVHDDLSSWSIRRPEKKTCRDNFQAWSNLKCIFAVKTLFTVNDGWRIFFLVSAQESKKSIRQKRLKIVPLVTERLREKSVTQQTLSLDRIQNRFPTDISSGLMDEFHGSELRTS